MVQALKTKLNPGESHLSIFWELVDPEHHYGGMLAFHAFPVEGGLRVDVHKNGAYDEKIDEFFMPLDLNDGWLWTMDMFRRMCAEYVENAP